MRKASILFMALTFAFSAFAQIRKTPAAVVQAFEKQYPNASKVQYEHNIVSVQVYFVTDSTKLTAKYNSDGEWKETDKEGTYDSVPEEVKTGFEKSKYSTDWKVKGTTIIYMPHNETRYRLKVEKSDLQKKYLYFDQTGRLVRESVTI